MTTDAPLIVVAIGGNAVYPPDIKGTAGEQLAVMASACERLVRVLRAGYRVVLTHGNGPVVGNILFRMARTSRELAPMPMDVCVAHSQGGMGYMLQQTLANVLARHGMATPVTSIVTQVEVDANDPAFANPTKPVGKFFRRRMRIALRRRPGGNSWRTRDAAGAAWCRRRCRGASSTPWR